MPTLSSVRWILFAVAVSGCGAPAHLLHRSGPIEGISTAGVTVTDVPVHGWPLCADFVERPGATDEQTTCGELLAVDTQGLWLRTDERPERIVRGLIRELELELYPNDGDWVADAVWTGAGAASAISHGYWMIFTGPAWLAVGIPLSAVAAAENDLEVPLESYAALTQFARFPAGIPAGYAGGAAALAAGPPPSALWVREERGSWMFALLTSAAVLGACSAGSFVVAGDHEDIDRVYAEYLDGLRSYEAVGSAVDRHNAWVGAGWGFAGAAALAAGIGLYHGLSSEAVPASAEAP
jgi:hypothetical protein